MSEVRRFWLFLLVVGLLLGGSAAISIVADPGLYDGNAYENGVVEILLSGQNVGNIKNYDERLLQKMLIERDRRQVGTIVLGSSRAMQIHNSTAIRNLGGDGVFLNHAVSGATLEDCIAIVELYHQRDTYPGTVIIGVDPWILNANNSQTRWRALEPEYRAGLARFGLSPVVARQSVTERGVAVARASVSLLSRDVVVRSLDDLLHRRTGYYATNREALDVAVKLSDGSRYYQAETRERTIEEIDAEARPYAEGKLILGLGRFTTVDEGLKQQYFAMIRYLESRNVTVVFFLAPYHPIVYDEITSDPQYANVQEVESLIHGFARAENITVVGSYDPYRLNMTSRDFFDDSHPDREAVDSLFASVDAATRETAGAADEGRSGA